MSEEANQVQELPWHNAQHDATMIVGAGGARIADCSVSFGLTQEEKEANARFIVRAANNHVALVAAVRHALDARVEYNGPCEHIPEFGPDCLQCELRSALEAATKGES